MSTQRDLRLFELLEEAASWPAASRTERADAACADGPVAAEELLAALARADRLSQYLESPPWDEEEVEGRSLPAVELGDNVGGFRLLEVLGEGGMGRVYLAEQQEPRRKVALKLVRTDLIGPEARTRFHAEQEALARLNHPHVAHFFEADVTQEGQPYFAMEWVDGEPLDAYFARRPPDLEQRLRVFLDVCSAVRHAHQKQVIHRDLKPSNILVREVDGRPVAKVIDFGISEALEARAGEQTSLSRRMLCGTPEYLSPESFDGDVDTRADVYSLGVVLYELLSGARPFPRGDESMTHYARRVLCGIEKPPSAALAATDVEPPSLFTEKARRRWTAHLRGDLDAVVQRAMHPDRERRYASVEELAADLEAFVDHRPVTVRDAGLLHRTRLLLRRRRAAVLAAAIAIVSLLAGLVGVTSGMLHAQREAAAAQKALEESEELVRFLSDLFQEADPSRARGEEPTAREILDQGAERLRGRLEDQPLARARLLRTIGDIYAKLGHFEPAGEMLEESLALYREQLGEDHRDVARAISGLAVLRTKAGKLDQAREGFVRALGILDRIPDADPNQLALAQYHLGVALYRQDDDAAAEVHFTSACGEAGTQVEADDELRARCLEAFGALRVHQDRHLEAEPLYLESLAIRRRILGDDHPHVAASLESLCILYRLLGDGPKAVPFCREMVALRRSALGEHHPMTARALILFANVRQTEGRRDEAEHLLQQGLDARLAGSSTDSSEVSRLWIRIAWLAWLREDYAEAMRRYGEAAALREEMDAEGWGRDLPRLGLALCEWKLGRLEAAADHLTELHARTLEHYGPESGRTAWTSWALAGVLRDRADAARGDLEAAGPLYELALGIWRENSPRSDEYLALAELDYDLFLERANRDP